MAARIRCLPAIAEAGNAETSPVNQVFAKGTAVASVSDTPAPTITSVVSPVDAFAFRPAAPMARIVNAPAEIPKRENVTLAEHCPVTRAAAEHSP